MKIIEKLRSRRGETLVELLVSMAILTLSICFMVTMVMLSARFDEQARDEDKTFKEELEAAEDFNAPPSGTAYVKFVLPAGTPDPGLPPIPVKIYSSADGELKSYRISP